MPLLLAIAALWAVLLLLVLALCLAARLGDRQQQRTPSPGPHFEPYLCTPSPNPHYEPYQHTSEIRPQARIARTGRDPRPVGQLDPM
jgi:hypothetical protein